MQGPFTPEQAGRLATLTEGLLTLIGTVNRFSREVALSHRALYDLLLEKGSISEPDFGRSLENARARQAIDTATDRRIQAVEEEIRRLLAGWNPMTD